MNAKEKFDDLILYIEDKACEPYCSAAELEQLAAQRSGIAARDLSAIFRYLTDYTTQSYIKERKMMASYRCLLQGDRLRIAEVLDISGFDSQSAFNKKFQAMFHCSPTEAFQAKDESRITAPLLWDAISCNTAPPPAAERQDETMEENTIFGITQAQYSFISKAIELSERYNFSKPFSDYAFALTQEAGYSPEDAFRFVESIRENLDDPSEEPYTEEEAESLLHSYGDDPYYRHMFFVLGISVYGAEELQLRVGLVASDVLTISDPGLFREYLKTDDMSFWYFYAAYEYYKAHTNGNYTDKDFDNYVDYLCVGMPYQEAFDEIWPSEDDGSYEDYYEDNKLDEDYELFEQWVAQEMSWDGGRLDEEVDLNNLAYEHEDSGYFDF
jgi:AraC-like DNA-binding protein